MIIFLLVGILPATVLVANGRARYPLQDMLDSLAGWAGFLSMGLCILLGLSLLAETVFGENGSLLVMVLLPAICVLFAESCLLFVAMAADPNYRRRVSSLGRRLGLLLIVLPLLAALGLLGDPFFL